MTTKRLTTRRNKLERQRIDVLEALTSGLPQVKVAEKFRVSREAISQFVRRHSEELTTRTQAIEATAEAYSIASKVWRISEAQKDFDRVSEWLNEHGLTQRSVRWDKDGNEVGETIALRKDALDVLRAYRREVAEELGALPRPDQNINVKAMMLIRQVEGADVEDLS